jgi:hypothetical protein
MLRKVQFPFKAFFYCLGLVIKKGELLIEGEIDSKTKSKTNGTKTGEASPQEEHHLRERREIFPLSLLSKGER